jgi:AraC family transcriptional regulator
MKVTVLVKVNQDSEAGVLPSKEVFAEMGKFNEALVKAGVLLAAEGLHPTSKGVRVRCTGKDRMVIDGPFAETKELLAGFWLWQVKSVDDAIEWVKRSPMQEGEIKIRPVFEFADFGAALTPEIRQQNERLRAESESFRLDPPRFENGRELLIAGINVRYTFETRVQIPAQWERFAPLLGKVPGQIGKTAYGVCWNYQPGRGFDYLCGVEVSSAAGLPADFSHVRLPAQRYAVFIHSKHVSLIPNTLDAIWRKWLPNSGYQAAETPSFERYSEDYNAQTGMGGTEIWVPIKK